MNFYAGWDTSFLKDIISSLGALSNPLGSPLYFAHINKQSCYDTWGMCCDLGMGAQPLLFLGPTVVVDGPVYICGLRGSVIPRRQSGTSFDDDDEYGSIFE